MPDPVDDLLSRLEHTLARATGRPASRNRLAEELNRSPQQLSQIRIPGHLYRRTRPQIDELCSRIQTLLDAWSAAAGSKVASGTSGRIDTATAEEMLAPYVEATTTGLKLVRSYLEKVSQSKWTGDPVSLNAVERFLDQDVCHTEDAWEPIVYTLSEAEKWSRGKHVDPYVSRVGHVIVRAAHRINANTPVRGTGSGPSPHSVLMDLTRRSARRAVRTSRDAHTIGSGYRVLGYARHARREYRPALVEFQRGIDLLRRTGNEASAEVPRLMLADVDARIASTSLRSAALVSKRLEKVLASGVRLDRDNRVRIAQSTAKLDLLRGRYRSAVEHVEDSVELRPLAVLSRHGRIEHWFLSSAAHAGLDSREARDSLDRAERLADEARLVPQLLKVERLRKTLRHPQSAAGIAVQGRLPYRHRG